MEVMEVRLFGELEALDGGVPVPVRGAKQRALLALLALQRGQPVSADRLIDLLWGDGQAANPANALQAQIGQLRRTLGSAAILTTEAGYALDVGPEDVDVVRFEHLVAQGRRLAEAGQAADASAALGKALGLRRGEPLADFTYAGFFDAERTRLDELTLAAMATGNLRERLSSFVGRRTARGAPGRGLARRVRERHRARRGCAGCGRRARGGRGRPHWPAFAGLHGGAHRALPGRTVASGRLRQL